MQKRFFNYRAGCSALVALLLAVAGCPEDKAPEPTAPPVEVADPVKDIADVQPEVEAKLAEADLLDGKADKIVTRCASCALKMDGSSEHTRKVLDYTLYFCTEGCAKTFAKNTTESVLAMNIPKD